MAKQNPRIYSEDMVQKTFHAASADWPDTAEKQQPFGRLIKLDEVANFVAVLLTERSGLMTGSIIDFDQNVVGMHV
jgi:NAD(P)-dependent dehydrogenase (short-subunit alcohol dehydrogenase family)